MLALPGEPPAGVEATSLTEEPLRLAVNLDDELAGGTVDDRPTLRGRPFILAEPGTALRETVVAATQAAGFSPLPLFEVGDPTTVRFLVRANLGLAIVPASWLERPGPVVGAADLLRRAVPPAVTAHARGGSVTGRPAAPRAPARALTRGGASGARRPASGPGRRC